MYSYRIRRRAIQTKANTIKTPAAMCHRIVQEVLLNLYLRELATASLGVWQLPAARGASTVTLCIAGMEAVRSINSSGALLRSRSHVTQKKEKIKRKEPLTISCPLPSEPTLQ